jgi:hypothetical protein
MAARRGREPSDDEVSDAAVEVEIVITPPKPEAELQPGSPAYSVMRRRTAWAFWCLHAPNAEKQMRCRGYVVKLVGDEWVSRPCGRKYDLGDDVSNITKHIKTHGLTGDSHPAVKKAMRDAEAADRDRLRTQFRPTKEPALTFDYNEKRALDAWTAYFCSTFGSFRDIERPQFKHFWSTLTNSPPPITCRRAFRNYVVSEADIAFVIANRLL